MQEIPGRRVQDALRLARRAARIKDEERRFGIQLRCGAIGIDVFQLAVPPHIAAFFDVYFLTGALENNDAFHRRIVALQRIVHVLFQRHHSTAAISTIGGHHDRRSAIDDTILDALCAETTEHHRVHRTDACASQHRDRRLRNHRHVNNHPRPFLRAVAQQHICKPAHLAMELCVGERALFPRRFALPDDGGLVLPRCAEMPVEAVFGDIDFSADEPLCIRAFPLEYVGPFFLPDEFLGLACEKLFGLFHALLPHRLVLRHRADAGLFGKLFGRFEDAVLDESGFDILAHGCWSMTNDEFRMINASVLFIIRHHPGASRLLRVVCLPEG